MPTFSSWTTLFLPFSRPIRVEPELSTLEGLYGQRLVNPAATVFQSNLGFADRFVVGFIFRLQEALLLQSSWSAASCFSFTQALWSVEKANQTTCEEAILAGTLASEGCYTDALLTDKDRLLSGDTDAM